MRGLTAGLVGPLGDLVEPVLDLGGQHDLHDLARLPNSLLAALRARFPTCSQSAFGAGILPFQQVT
jgi:hypothetical protein